MEQRVHMIHQKDPEYRNYARDRLYNFAKVHNINDEEEVEFWLTAFESYIHEAQVNRIKFGNDDIPINVEESISTMEDLLIRKYG